MYMTGVVCRVNNIADARAANTDRASQPRLL